MMGGFDSDEKASISSSSSLSYYNASIYDDYITGPKSWQLLRVSVLVVNDT